MVPPCFAAPLQTRPCAGTSGERSNGRTRRRLNDSPAQLRDHVPLRAACPVPSFGLSVRRRRGVLFSSQPVYIIIFNIRKIGGFVKNEMSTSQSASQTAPLPRGASGEEGKRYDMPRPLLQGEVARRRRDGEVGRRKACRNQKERVKLHNPSRPGSYNRAAPCCRPRPHGPDAWSSP